MTYAMHWRVYLMNNEIKSIKIGLLTALVAFGIMGVLSVSKTYAARPDSYCYNYEKNGEVRSQCFPVAVDGPLGEHSNSALKAARNLCIQDEHVKQNSGLRIVLQCSYFRNSNTPD